MHGDRGPSGAPFAGISEFAGRRGRPRLHQGPHERAVAVGEAQPPQRGVGRDRQDLSGQSPAPREGCPRGRDRDLVEVALEGAARPERVVVVGHDHHARAPVIAPREEGVLFGARGGVLEQDALGGHAELDQDPARDLRLAGTVLPDPAGRDDDRRHPGVEEARSFGGATAKRVARSTTWGDPAAEDDDRVVRAAWLGRGWSRDREAERHADPRHQRDQADEPAEHDERLAAPAGGTMSGAWSFRGDLRRARRPMESHYEGSTEPCIQRSP